MKTLFWLAALALFSTSAKTQDNLAEFTVKNNGCTSAGGPVRINIAQPYWPYCGVALTKDGLLRPESSSFSMGPSETKTVWVTKSFKEGRAMCDYRVEQEGKANWAGHSPGATVTCSPDPFFSPNTDFCLCK